MNERKHSQDLNYIYKKLIMENKYNGSYSMLCVYRLSNKMFEVQNTPRKIVSTVT